MKHFCRVVSNLVYAQTFVRVHRPTTLLQAVSLAKMIEDKLTDTFGSSFAPRTFLPTIKPSQALLPSPPPLPPSNKPIILIQKLTTTQMIERREKGLCYNCDEKFHQWHRCKGQMLALLPIEDHEETPEDPTFLLMEPESGTVESTDLELPEISFHALAG